MSEASDQGSAPQWIAWRWFTQSPREAIYGTVVTAAVLATERTTSGSLTEIVTSVLVTLLVYWLAHVYCELLAEHGNGQSDSARRLSVRDVRRILANEGTVAIGGLVVLGVLVVVWLSEHDVAAAVSVALWFVIAELAAWGTLAAKRAGLAVVGLTIYGLVSALFGIAMVLLKSGLHYRPLAARLPARSQAEST
jgi:hypothetical protein